uniref:Protein transport protein Sec61 subunit beta n=1 Tax=Rhabditophanes sp. KR3021 TaxID=114890 RepID=A0AC35TWW1_9BILA
MADASKSPKPSARPAGATSGAVKQRTGTASTTAPRATNSGGWRFYTDDAPGMKIGPVPVLVISLAFIFCVFVLHTWGKLTRASAAV